MEGRPAFLVGPSDPLSNALSLADARSLRKQRRDHATLGRTQRRPLAHAIPPPSTRGRLRHRRLQPHPQPPALRPATVPPPLRGGPTGGAPGHRCLRSRYDRHSRGVPGLAHRRWNARGRNGVLPCGQVAEEDDLTVIRLRRDHDRLIVWTPDAYDLDFAPGESRFSLAKGWWPPEQAGPLGIAWLMGRESRRSAFTCRGRGP